MKPSIGRIVFFVSNLGVTHPAIVIAVHSDTCVSLEVFGLPAGERVVTSVTHGPKLGQWSWPTRA